MSLVMKIALITYRADPARGGAERYTCDLARALTERGHAVSILHATPPGYPLATGIAHTLIKANGLTRAGRYQAFLRSVENHLQSEHFDIVHAMLPTHHCDIYQPHAGLAMSALTSRGSKSTSPLMRKLSRWAASLNQKRRLYANTELALLTSRPAPAVICLSAAMSKHLQSIVQIDPDNLVVIPNAIDLKRYDRTLRPDAGTEVRRRFDIAPEQQVGLFLAQDFARKGLKASLHAVAQLRDPAFTLLVVGPDNPAPFQRLANRLGLSRRVVFAGPTDDPYPFYAAANVVLFPSLFDPFGLVPAEALAMGVPSIVSRCCGVSELLTQDHNALIIEDPEDVPALTATLRRALEHATQTRLAKNCLLTRSLFSYDAHLDAMLRLYESRSAIAKSS